MKNRKNVPVAMACIAMGVATMIWIQHTTAADPQPGAQQQPQQQDQQRLTEQQTKFHLDRAKEILNRDVRNRQDEKLGKLEELAIDVDRGVVAYAVLDVGGFLGIGGKHVAVPLEALNIEHRPGEARDTRITLDMDKDRIKNAPGAFDKDSWPDMSNKQLATDIHRHYGVRPYWEMERERERDLKGEPISPQQPGEQPAERDRARADQPGKKIFKLEADLLNRDLKNQAKEDLGDVKDFLVDHNSGEIAFVVVEFNEASKLLEDDKGKRMAALPYQLLEFRKDEGDKGAFILTSNAERIRGQLFSNEQWPKLTEREWAVTVYRHYDLQPYWESRTTIIRERRGDQREEPQPREQQDQQN